MGYLGLVPSESSTGDKIKRGGITKAGNGRARRILVEAAWSYRYPPRVGREKQPKWRLHRDACARSRGKRKPDYAGASGHLSAKASGEPIVATAVARELSAFIWSINREIMGNRQA